MAERVILKDHTYPGINKAIFDFDLKPLKAKVLEPMFKKGPKTYICLATLVLPGEVIRVGNLGIRYRVQQENYQIGNTGGYIVRIKRLDGNNTTQTDINAVQVGMFAKIAGRKNFQQQLDETLNVLKQ